MMPIDCAGGVCLAAEFDGNAGGEDPVKECLPAGVVAVHRDGQLIGSHLHRRGRVVHMAGTGHILAAVIYPHSGTKFQSVIAVLLIHLHLQPGNIHRHLRRDLLGDGISAA